MTEQQNNLRKNDNDNAIADEILKIKDMGYPEGMEMELADVSSNIPTFSEDMEDEEDISDPTTIEDIYNYSTNRELSWLNFNRRVLHEALDESTPLYERMKFIAIFMSNLNEFYMVRVGSLTDLSYLKEITTDNKTGMTPKEQLQAIYKKTAELVVEKDEIFNQVKGELEKLGIIDLEYKYLSKSAKRKVEAYYSNFIEPILSPQIIDPHHPFPFIENDSLYIVAELVGEHSKPYGLVPVPKSISRYYVVAEGLQFIRTENIIKQLSPSLFTNFKVKNAHVINVIRNTDLEIEEDLADHDQDYRSHMKRILKKRNRLQAVRLNSDSPITDGLLSFLLTNLSIKKNQFFVTNSPLALKFVYDLEDEVKLMNLNSIFNEPYTPQSNPMFNMKKPLINQILDHDVLFIYPYEDINEFIKILEEASNDPRVLSIKITIYRLSKNSKIVQNLIRAAENGKEVTVIMELQARFDEESNINYSDVLYEAGCNIIYGVSGYKTHSKICLITMSTDEGIRHITQIGTGNYNEQTSKLYTDLSLVTANESIGEDAVEFFKNMNIGNIDGVYDQLIVSPVSFKQTIIKLMDEEIRKGTEGRLFFKFNSLTDKDIIKKLSEASNAGVKTRMIIRGISCLRPEVEGYTDNVECRSIVGRYLEHPRIYKFGSGEDSKIYIGSADLMTRNTERRVEIAVPLLDEEVRNKVKNYLYDQWKDNTKARNLTCEGVYRPIDTKPSDKLINAQEEMMRISIEQAKLVEEEMAPVEVPKESIFDKIKRFFS